MSTFHKQCPECGSKIHVRKLKCVCGHSFSRLNLMSKWLCYQWAGCYLISEFQFWVLVVIMCEKILFELSGPHTGVFGRKDLCNSRIYLLTKDAEINVALWIISCSSIMVR